MAYQIKRHEAIIPAVGQTWECEKDSWRITNILKVDGVPYQVVVADLCHPRALSRTISMKYFQKKFQNANVWIPLKKVKRRK